MKCLNYGTDDDGLFTGELPDGDITHDEDEFFDAWSEEDIAFPYYEEDWL